ncbi:MAG: ABC transporter substrate-binding protein [Jatrophihabitans sp.]|uniref:ABC transporter substrate-binding protein n=1 Tax=Jatrophihabitans sp. TaxID=1932789 RepID=UPI003F7E4C77
MERLTRSRLGITIASAAALAVTLTACSSSGSKGGGGSSTATGGGTTSTPAAGPSSTGGGTTSGFKVDTSNCNDPSSVTKPVTGDWKIGYSLPLSGPVAGVVEYYLEGWKAHINAFNAAGGINGKKIDVEYKDDQFTPDRAKSNLTQFLQSDHVNSLITFGSGGVGAMADTQNAACVPLLYPSSSVQAYRDIKQYPWTVQFLPSGEAEANYDVKYILSKFPDGAKVGIAVNQTQSGIGERDAFKAAAKGTKLTIAVEADETDPNSAATKLKAANVDVVYNAGISTDCGPLVTAMSRIGFTPKFTLNPDNCADTTAYIQAGQAANGNVVPSYLKNPADPSLANDPGVKTYLSEVTTSNKLNAIAVAGWVAADLTINTLKQAAGMSGGLTEGNVIAAARDQDYACPMLGNGITWISKPDELVGFSGFQTQVWDAASKTFKPDGGVISIGAK